MTRLAADADKLFPRRAMTRLLRPSRLFLSQLEGAYDERRLRRRLETFPSLEDVAKARRRIQPAYDVYVQEVSTSGMAASLETCSLLLTMCRALDVTSAVDLGSGFSSYVLALWSKESGARVCSVDDDPAWLNKTDLFLQSHGLTTTLSRWPSVPEAQVDLVFHDLSQGTLRESSMAQAVRLAGRFIVFDDAQHRGHRAMMKLITSQAKVDLFSIRSLTLDGIGRYAVLGLRPQ